MFILDIWNKITSSTKYQNTELLKKKLGLRRDEPVPISCISHLEELASTVKINGVGDYTYHSKRNCKRVVNLILCNGHYSIAKNPNRKYIKAWYSEPKS